MTISPVSADEFRLAMRQWTSGVTIVAAEADGVRHGMTASSFTSISAAPPLILVSMAVDTRTHAVVKQSGKFGVTILNESQREISDRFAGRIQESGERFEGVPYITMVTGSPLIVGGLAMFDCRVVDTYPMPGTTLFIAEVVAARVNDGANPLLYFNRQYHRLQG